MRLSLSPDGLPVAMGQFLALPPKEREVLAMLIAEAPSAVSKDKLLRTVWSGRPASDESLARCISQLRRRLPGVTIESLYGHGYRLVPGEEELDALFQNAAQAPSPALNAYLYANGLVQARTLPSLREALRILAELRQRYPRFAPAPVLQATAIAAGLSWGLAGELGCGTDEAFAHLDAAARIDADCPGMHACRAWLLDLGWRFGEAACCYALARSTAPHDIAARCYHARHLLALGEADQAVELLRPIPELQPYSVLNRHLYGLALFFAGRRDEALSEATHAAALHPRNAVAEGLRLLILLSESPGEDLLLQARRLAAGEQGAPYFTGVLAYALARCGRHDEALDQVSVARIADPLRLPGLAFCLAALAELGRVDEARQVVEALFATGSGPLPMALHDPLVAPLCRDGRVEAIRRSIIAG